MEDCPICGKTHMEQPHWVKCPKEKKNVCMKHCYNDCGFLKDSHCSYRKGKDNHKYGFGK